jgi:hypothetical protein
VAWLTRSASDRLARWAITRGNGTLGGRRPGQSNVVCGLLRSFLSFRGKLVLQVLNVVVGVVLHQRLRRLMLRSGRFVRCGLSVCAQDRCHDHKPRRAQVHQGLDVLPEYTFGIDGLPAQLRFRIHRWLRDDCFTHRRTLYLLNLYPFRENSRFFPTSK